jgi:YggT family protein
VIPGLFSLLFLAIRLYVWALILAAVFSMLTSFGVLDTRNRLVWTIGDFLYRVTDPLLRPIRNALPNLGGIDISPIVVIAVLELLVQPVLRGVEVGIMTGYWQGIFF